MRRRVVLLVAAVLLALAGTTAVLAYVSGADERALGDTEAAEVLVATADIPAGTPVATLRARGLATPVRFPLSTLPPDALTTLDALGDDGVLRRAVGARELLLPSMFGSAADAGRDTVAGLTLPPGTAAVPVSFKSFPNAADWSGWFRPGAEVAVYATFTARDPSKAFTPRGDGLGENPPDTQVTRLLLDRVSVVAVGNGVDASAGDAGSSSTEAPSLVLALTQPQSERLIMGLARQGQLYPVLLAPGSGVAPSPGTADTQLFDALPTTAPGSEVSR